MPKMTEKTIQKISESFDTRDLLTAVKLFDAMRSLTADQEDFRPPEIRENLLKLHQILHKSVNESLGLEDEEELWDLVYELEDEVFTILEYAQKIHDTLEKLTAFAPDLDGEDDEGNESIML